MSKNIITELKANIKFLTKAERKIAGIIIEKPAEFITYTMTELAERAGVSQGSIINFSKKYANGGFPELKLQISACIGAIKTQDYNVVTEGDSLKVALEKNIKALDGAYAVTKGMNDEETLRDVTELILNAKKVEIYGIFRSGAVATDFCYQLLQLGIPASFVSDILTCSISAGMLDEKSLVIAISSSGKTKDIIDAVKNAKANNVPIVSLTSNINSPLAKLSDKVLIASASGNGLSNGSTEVRSSQLLLTDTICSYIRSKMGSEEEKRYSELRRILSSHSVDEVEYDKE